MSRDTGLAKRLRRVIASSRPNCHICGSPINWEAHRDAPDSFVIDHVIPLATGGADALSNMRAAHRVCNSRKRARLIAPIVRRSNSLQ